MQYEGLTNGDLDAWIQGADWHIFKKDRDRMINLIDKSDIRSYVSNLQSLAYMLRTNLSIVRSNFKLCQNAFKIFLRKQAQEKPIAGNQNLLVRRFKPSQRVTNP